MTGRNRLLAHAPLGAWVSAEDACRGDVSPFMTSLNGVLVVRPDAVAGRCADWAMNVHEEYMIRSGVYDYAMRLQQSNDTREAKTQGLLRGLQRVIRPPGELLSRGEMDVNKGFRTYGDHGGEQRELFQGLVYLNG